MLRAFLIGYFNGWRYRRAGELAGNCQKAKKASGVKPPKKVEPPRFCPRASGVGRVLQDGLSSPFIRHCMYRWALYDCRNSFLFSGQLGKSVNTGLPFLHIAVKILADS